VDGVEVTDPSLDRAVVFQSPSLLPWLTAGQNVLLAARQAHPGMPRRKCIEVARRYMDMVGIGEFRDQLPAALSQGTQQRVAIARALSAEPRFLLLDEPFGMLDSITRAELQVVMLGVWESQRKTVILVTDDVDEALYMSDRILLMTDGPEARLGEQIYVTFPRPRSRAALADDPEYFNLRRQILTFLEDHAKQFIA